MDPKVNITDYINEHFLRGRVTSNIDDVSFLEEGIIDSVGVMELVAFLEEKFGFRVEDDEIIPDNLDSINRLCHYVATKLNNKT